MQSEGAWSILVIVAAGHKPTKENALKNDTQSVPPTERWRVWAGVVSPEFSEQLQCVGCALFRNHDALSVVVPNLKSGQETPEMPTVNEHWDVVRLQQRSYNRKLGLRLWRQDSNESHDLGSTHVSALRCARIWLFVNCGKSSPMLYHGDLKST